MDQIIKIKRIFQGEDYTIGRFLVNNLFFCDSLEDKDRGLTNDMSVEEILKIKVAGATAIPTGRYEIDLNRLSPKYSKIPFYQRVCGGYVPYIKNVKGFEGILIHAGNTNKDTRGCPLVGRNTIKGELTASKKAFEQLYTDFFAPARKRGDKVFIEITN